MVGACGNVFEQISRQYWYSFYGKLCFIWNVYFQCFIIKKWHIFLFLYMTKILLYIFLFYLSCFVFLEPAFFALVGNFFFPHSWSNNRLLCGILRKIFVMRKGDYEQIINYDWPSHCKRLLFFEESLYFNHYIARFRKTK